MSYSNAELWLMIALLAVGTFLIRFSFLGLIGDRPLPDWVLRMLRYTPVAVLPGMVAPLVLWPAANDSVVEPVRLIAALVTLGVGYWRGSFLAGIGSGAAALYLGLLLTGQL
jgi:branched-subunit amino acid transport protein